MHTKQGKSISISILFSQRTKQTQVEYSRKQTQVEYSRTCSRLPQDNKLKLSLAAKFRKIIA